MSRTFRLATTLLLLPALAMMFCAVPECRAESSSDADSEYVEPVLIGLLVVVVAVLVILGIRADYGGYGEHEGSHQYVDSEVGEELSAELIYGFPVPGDLQQESGLELTASGLRARF